MPVKNARPAKPDVIASPSGGVLTHTSHGTTMFQAPKGARNQLGVALRANTQDSATSAYAPEPSGVVDRLNRSFVDYPYYNTIT